MTSLALVPKTELSPTISQISQNFLDQVNGAGKITAEILQGLIDIGDEEIVELRFIARRLGVYAWVLECACDAEIWERHKPFKATRGRLDTEGVGLIPALKSHALKVGYTPQTIRRNYRIFRTFRDQLAQTVQILSEKEFYQVALKHKENPQEALNLFIEERKKDPKFGPADAKRLLTRQLSQDKIQQLESMGTDIVLQHIESVIAKINEFKREAPDKRLVTSYYEEWCRQLAEYLEDYSLLINEEKVLRAIERGHHKESQIASYTQLPIKSVLVILNELEENGQCESVFQRGETEVARGGHIKLWHKVGDPTGDAYRAHDARVSFLGEDDESGYE